MRLRSFRLLSQLVFLFLSIIGIAGLAATGLIFPYFFCNASPGAVCVCPIWALEHASILMRLDFKTALAMILFLFGFLGIIGFVVGRSFCGWACPIGFIQDISNRFRGKIEFPLNILAGAFITGWILVGTVYMFTGPLTGYLATAGIAIVAISLYALLKKIGKWFINVSECAPCHVFGRTPVLSRTDGDTIFCRCRCPDTALIDDTVRITVKTIVPCREQDSHIRVCPDKFIDVL